MFKVMAWITAAIPVVFYIPSLIQAFLYHVASTLLLKSAQRKYGGLGGRRTVWGLRLHRLAISILREVSVDTATFITQLERGEVMKAIDSTRSYPYIPKADRDLPPKDQTQFMCKMLNSHTQATLGDQIYAVTGTGNQRKEQLRTGTQFLEILKSNLVGWNNFKDEDGKDVEFGPDMFDNIDRIPPPVRTEIADFIRGDSEASEGEG